MAAVCPSVHMRQKSSNVTVYPISSKSHALGRLDDAPLSAVADRGIPGVVWTMGAAPALGVDQSLATVEIQKASLLDCGVAVTKVGDVVGTATSATEVVGCTPVALLMVIVIVLSVTLSALSLTARCTT